jgi:nicotinamide mononucleotide (NMN) deamidase PncC
MEETQRSQERDADLAGAALKHSGRTLAVAESLTGGLLSSAFARASGSGEWFRGGIVAYSSAVKYDLLDVPGGPVVSETAAVAMARGAGRLLEADVAVAVTGVGGPDPRTTSLPAPYGSPPGLISWAVPSCSACRGHRKASASRCARRRSGCSGSASNWRRPVPAWTALRLAATGSSTAWRSCR